MIGVPGAGKTTYALTKLKNAVYIGTDDLRKEIFGKEMTLRGRKKVYAILEKRLKCAIKDGADVVLDCANTTKKRRKKLINMIAGNGHVIGIWIRTPLSHALKNNKRRSRYVFPGGIFLMWLFFSRPAVKEGFDEIRIISGEVYQVFNDKP